MTEKQILQKKLEEIQKQEFLEMHTSKISKGKSLIGKYFCTKFLNSDIKGRKKFRNICMNAIKIEDSYLSPDSYSNSKINLNEPCSSLIYPRACVMLKCEMVTVELNKTYETVRIDITTVNMPVSDIGRYYETSLNVYQNFKNLVTDSIRHITNTSIGFLKM